MCDKIKNKQRINIEIINGYSCIDGNTRDSNGEHFDYIGDDATNQIWFLREIEYDIRRQGVTLRSTIKSDGVAWSLKIFTFQ